MTTRSRRVENTIIYDPATDRRALRPAAGPDDRLQGAQGRPDRQHPGRARGGGEDRRQADRQFGTLDAPLRADRRGQARASCAPLLLRGTSERVLESRELPALVRDLPVELDLEAARLGDYDREAVIRLFREYEFRTLIDRLPPLPGRDGRARRRPRRCATRPASVGAAGPGRPAGAGRRARHRRAAGARRRAACSSRSTSTRSARPPAAGTPGATPLPAGDLPAALAGARRRPGPECERADAAGGVAALGRVAGGRCPRSASRWSSTTRGRGAARPLALALAGEDGAGRRADGPEAVGAAPARPRGGRDAARRPRGQAAARRPLRGRPGAAPTPSRSTRRSPPTS